MRVFYPLKLTKKGRPRKRQRPVVLAFNGDTIIIKRGVVVDINDCHFEVAKFATAGGIYDDMMVSYSDMKESKRGANE